MHPSGPARRDPDTPRPPIGSGPPTRPPEPHAAPPGTVGSSAAEPRDPHGLGAAVRRLGQASRKAARVSLGIASAALQQDEQVELVIHGRINDVAGVAVLSDRRLLLVNEAEWVPLVESIPFDPDLRVDGEADGQRASLTITTPQRVHRVIGSREIDLTKGFAARLRAHAAEA